MDKQDINNLRFLLQKHSEGEEAIQEWMDSVEQDELQYALRLLQFYTSNKEHFDNIINQYFE